MFGELYQGLELSTKQACQCVHLKLQGWVHVGLWATRCLTAVHSGLRIGLRVKQREIGCAREETSDVTGWMENEVRATSLAQAEAGWCGMVRLCKEVRSNEPSRAVSMRQDRVLGVGKGSKADDDEYDDEADK